MGILSAISKVSIFLAVSYLPVDAVSSDYFYLGEPSKRGKASYYGDPETFDERDGGMYGKYTASGDVFTPYRKTCAMRNRPLGSIVIVENKSNEMVSYCVVNDRGPYAADYYGEGWGIMMRTDNGYITRKRVNKSWKPKRYHSKKPGDWRAMIDLTYESAKDINFPFRDGFAKVNIW